MFGGAAGHQGTCSYRHYVVPEDQCVGVTASRSAGAAARSRGRSSNMVHVQHVLILNQNVESPALSEGGV